jgi:hypothetical protein
VTDLLRQGCQWLERMRTSHCSSPVTYRRAGQADANVQATFGRTDYEVADDYGATIKAHVIDFLILGDDLGSEPQAGDQIVADPSAGAGQAAVYEVMALGGEGCWRWSDPYRTTMRIHTKEIGPAEN